MICSIVTLQQTNINFACATVKVWYVFMCFFFHVPYVGVEVNMENENIILISNNLLNEHGPDMLEKVN